MTPRATNNFETSPRQDMISEKEEFLPASFENGANGLDGHDSAYPSPPPSNPSSRKSSYATMTAHQDAYSALPTGGSVFPSSPGRTIEDGSILFDSFQSGHGSSSSRRRPTSGLHSKRIVILGLKFSWIVLVIWYEVGTFFHSMSTCKYPDARLHVPSSTLDHTVGKNSHIDKPEEKEPFHVLLVTDPHVPHVPSSSSSTAYQSLHPASYSFKHEPPPRGYYWLDKLSAFIVDLNMKKAWNVALRLGKVDAIMMVGDLLDQGRGVMSDEEYVGPGFVVSFLFR